MQNKREVVRLIQIAGGLWLVYIGISAAIDYSLKSPGPLENYLYIADSAIAVFFLIIAFWPWMQERLGKTFLPLMITLIAALPILFNQVLVRYSFSGTLPPPEAMLARVGPFLLIALLLVAWQYKWQHILLFSLSIALVNIFILWAFRSNLNTFSNGLFAIITQVVTFLVVGFFISVIVTWLRNRSCSLEEANAKLKNYAQTLEDLAVSKERTRIAQELHDTLSHTLSGLSVQLETMKAYWEIDPITARERLDKSLNATRSGLEETRRIFIALRAKPLEELGFVPAVRQLAEEAASRSGLALKLELSENLSALTPEVEQVFFRVAQEAITNVLQHAKASQLSVKLGVQDKKISLTIQDNGVGFNINVNGGKQHFGLVGMKERAELINGELTIESLPDKGTTVKLSAAE